MEGLLAVFGKHVRIELPLVLGGVLPLVGLGAGDLSDEVLAQDGPALGLLHQLLCRGGQVGCDDPVQRPGIAQPAGDRARVHVRDACAMHGGEGRAGLQCVLLAWQHLTRTQDLFITGLDEQGISGASNTTQHAQHLDQVECASYRGTQSK